MLLNKTYGQYHKPEIFIFTKEYVIFLGIDNSL